ncbi:MAG: hypothetical protein JKY88_06560 [Pseudomonadales bacterium]|nr:hypothetical protein [Pseudomonadales bacterium]
MLKDFKREEILERIESLETDITKAEEYLETGENENWHKFKPIFKSKVKDGKELPPHKDWVKNVFLPDREKALDKAERLLERFE